MPQLSIIVTSYKNPELLKLCLKSIQENVDLDYDLIVCDSATEEETEMMMREEFPQVKFFAFQKNVGFQALVNKGISEAKAEYLLLLNGDILVKKNSVEKLLEFVKEDEKIGLAGPKLLNFNDKFQASCFRFYRPLTIVYRRTILGKLPWARRHLDWFLMKDYDHQQPREVDWVQGSAMLIRKKALQKVGAMDKRFFMYMEDVDWCRRFWKVGYKVVYYPQSVMHHYHGQGSARGGFLRSLFRKLTWIHIISALKYFWKYRGEKNPHKG